MKKRIRFVISTFVMCALMLFATFFFFDSAWILLPILIISAYLVTYFSILEGIEKVEWVMLFLMPILFTVAFYLFYFLFPIRWLTRVPFILFYGFTFYALLLINNIFNVGVQKSLQLYRAAFAVNYFFQMIVIFLMLNVIFSFKQNFFIEGILIFIITFPLGLQLLWSLKLDMAIRGEIVKMSLFLSLILLELGVGLSFIPIKSTIHALFLTGIYYSLSGLVYHYLDQKLFQQTIREYLIVIGFVSIVVLLSIQW